MISRGSIAAALILLCSFTAAGQTLSPQQMLDPLDPRLPSPAYELWARTRTTKTIRYDFERYRRGFFRNFVLDSLTSKLIMSPERYPIKIDNNDFRFWIGFRLSENWLGFKENRDDFSSLQSSVSISGNANIKNKVDFYEDITLYREDNTLNIDRASQTGEFLRDPLTSYPAYWPDPLEGGPLDFDIAADRAVIALNLYGVDITTGHERIIQKPGYRNGLLFSGLARPIDLFYKFDYRFWKISLTSFAGQLSGENKKYIAGKRVTIAILRNLSIGLAEAVSYFDDPTAYINPIMPVFVSQRQRPNNDDNLLAAVDISYRPTQDIQLYAEFLNDDFMYLENEDRGPSKYAFLAGVARNNLIIDRLDLRIEYCRASKWTYTHVSRVNSWSHAGQPLGFWLGPDADELFCQLSWIAGSSSLFRIAFDRVRKGEGTLDLPYEIEGGDKSPKFPSGIVEKSNGVWVDINEIIGRFSVAARTGFRQIKNSNNTDGRAVENPFIHIIVSADM